MGGARGARLDGRRGGRGARRRRALVPGGGRDPRGGGSRAPPRAALVDVGAAAVPPGRGPGGRRRGHVELDARARAPRARSRHGDERCGPRRRHRVGARRLRAGDPAHERLDATARRRLGR